jgi:hypothetical protein
MLHIMKQKGNSFSQFSGSGTKVQLKIVICARNIFLQHRKMLKSEEFSFEILRQLTESVLDPEYDRIRNPLCW